MRIAIVCTNYFPVTCGVGDHSMRLAQALTRQGHDVRIFCRQPAQPHPEAHDLDVTALSAPTPAVLAAKMGAAVLAFAPSLCVLQYTPLGLGAGRFGSAGMPAIATLLRARGVRVRSIIHEAYPPRRLRPDLLVGGALMRAEFIGMLASSEIAFLTTESRASYFREHVATKPFAERIRLLAIGANALPTRAKGITGNKRMGTFSTLSVGKRVDVVLGAFDVVTRSHPDAELILMGDYGEGRAQVESMIRHHRAASRITVTGKLALDEVSTTIASLGLYLFPMDTGANTRSGTLPVALGAGVPVVTTRGHETSDAFGDGVNVVIARALEGAAFGEAALRVLGDEGLAERVAAGGRDFYARELSWERAVERILDGVR